MTDDQSSMPSPTPPAPPSPVQPPDRVWLYQVEYAGGAVIDEIDAQGHFHGFTAEVEREQVIRLSLISQRPDLPSFTVDMDRDAGDLPIFFRRHQRGVLFNAAGEEVGGFIMVATVIGIARGEMESLIAYLDDGTEVRAPDRMALYQALNDLARQQMS